MGKCRSPCIDEVSYKKRHIQQIFNYFIHPITSDLAEGLNNLIATVKKKAYPPTGGSKYRIL
jgi:hypothetical protein